MATILFANNASTTLAGSISGAATTANLAAGGGALMPAPAAGQYFLMTFIDAATGLLNEIVRVTNVTGDTVTIVRAQEGTIARAWTAGDIAANYWTAGSAASLLQQGDFQTQITNYGVDSGTANAIVVTLSPAIVSLASMTGAPIRIKKSAAANSSSTITVTVNGLSASLTNPDATGISIGALTAGIMIEVFFDGTAFRLLSAQANVNQIFAGVTTMASASLSGLLSVGTSFSVGTSASVGTTLSVAGIGTLSSGFNGPNSSGLNGSGTFTGYSFQNQALVYLNPAVALMTIENAAGGAAQFSYSGSSPFSALGLFVRDVAAPYASFFYQGVNTGSITTNGSSTSFLTTSDETWKDFIGVYDPAKAMEIIRADPTRDFTWNTKAPMPGKYAIGWGAQTSYAVSKDLAQPGGWFLPPVVKDAVWSPEVWAEAVTIPDVVGEDGTIVTPAVEIPRHLVTPSVMLEPAVETEPGREVGEGTPGAIYRLWGVDQGKRTPYLWAVMPWFDDRIKALEQGLASRDDTIADLVRRLKALEDQSAKGAA